MPDTLNKQAIVNLLIDSPLREPIKINLIDIVNNTNEPDLPKVYSTIVKELEIFQKATERRMKLAEETIAKLGGTSPVADATTASPPVAQPNTPPTPPSPTLPPLDLPSLPTPPAPPVPTGTLDNGNTGIPSSPPLSVPPLDLPPLPTASSAPTPSSTQANSSEAQTPPLASGAGMPPLEPLGAPANSSASDEDALAEIQKELDSLKTEAATDISKAAAPAPAVATAPAK